VVLVVRLGGLFGLVLVLWLRVLWVLFIGLLLRGVLGLLVLVWLGARLGLQVL
jgi:hypothetical protein